MRSEWHILRHLYHRLVEVEVDLLQLLKVVWYLTVSIEVLAVWIGLELLLAAAYEIVLRSRAVPGIDLNIDYSACDLIVIRALRPHKCRFDNLA